MSKITFEIDGKEYKLPVLITIGDYVKIFKVKNLFEDEYFSAKIISILTGAPMDKLMESPREQIKFLSDKILEIIPYEKPAFLDRFTLDGVDYGFIPSWKRMSFGEFADLDTLMTKKEDEILDYYHIITAILYRPITKSKSEHNFEIEKYNQDTLYDRAELFKNKLDVEVALGAQFFFIKFAENVLNPTQISLKTWMRISWSQIRVAWKMRKTLWNLVWKKDLDGFSFSTEYATMILQDIRKLLKKQL
jgi:hypothetical protein